MDFGSASARERFILEHLGMVYSTQRRFYRSVPAVVAEDIIGEGTIGLIRAVDTFDPNRDVQFATHAFGCIRRAMADYLRREDFLTRTGRRLVESGSIQEPQCLSLESLIGDDLALLEAIPDPSPGPEEIVLSHRDTDLLHRVCGWVRELPPDERSVIDENVIQGRGLQQFAKQRGQSYYWANQLKTRALNTLRARCEAAG